MDLARSGYNLTLVSRSQQKLDIVEKQLRRVNPEIKTRTVSFDVSNAKPQDNQTLFTETE